MKLQIRSNQMEEIEGLHSQYPYAYHHVDLSVTTIPWHWHEALEFNFVVSGSLKVTTTGQSQTFQKGQGYFINSNILSTVTTEEDCVFDSHLFHPIFLGGHFNSIFETKYLQPVTQNKHLELIPLRGDTEIQRQILGKLRLLARLQGQEDTEFATRNLLSEVWLLLLEEARQLSAQSPGPGHRNQDRILTMIAYLQEHYSEKITLEDIAASAAISTRECLRCFRTSIHQSPMEYLASYRVDQAKKLLQTTRLPITEIALHTGFNSPAYFSKVFGQHTGKTPAAYRKEVTP